MSKITTHILDVSRGQPADGVSVILEFFTESGWKQLASKRTDADGRIKDLLADDHLLESGIYRLSFDTTSYFESRGQGKFFYPYVPVVFEVRETDQHYHVPLLLSPFGYSTYRGS